MHLSEYLLHFHLGHLCRGTTMSFCLDRLNLSINRLIQNIAVKKDHGAQRLPLCGR
jgi:hypothetical protein